MPYTCFSSVKSYFENNKDKLKKFTNAIKKGLDYINNNETNKIIEYLKPSFITSKDEEIISVINNYKKIEAWPNKLGFTQDNFNKLIDIVKEAGELDKDTKIPYDKIVTNEMIN